MMQCDKERLRPLLLYVIFGVLTTIVNVVVYWLCMQGGMGNVPSVCVAWIVSVLFAFVTNRQYVFAAHRDAAHGWLYQLLSFVSFRLLSGVLDVGIMWLTVDVLHWADVPMKIVANVVVVVLNYVVSKLFVFKRNDR